MTRSSALEEISRVIANLDGALPRLFGLAMGADRRCLCINLKAARLVEGSRPVRVDCAACNTRILPAIRILVMPEVGTEQALIRRSRCRSCGRAWTWLKRVPVRSSYPHVADPAGLLQGRSC